MKNKLPDSKRIHFQYNAGEKWLQDFATQLQTKVKDRTLQIPARAGTGTIRHWVIKDELALTYWDCTLSPEVAFAADDLQDYYSICCFFSYEHLPAGSDRSFTLFLGEGTNALEHFSQNGTKTKAIHTLIKKTYFEQSIAPDLPESLRSLSGKMLINKPVLVLLTQFTDDIELNAGNKLYIQGFSYHLLSLLLDLYIHKNSAKKRYLTEAEQLMALNKNLEQKCFDDLISIPEMAATLHMSVTKFKQLFNEIYDTTFLQYHIRLRLLKAQEMLRQPKIRMSEIALRSGYSGISHFAKAYKKHFGNSPAEYRKEYFRLLEKSPA